MRSSQPSAKSRGSNKPLTAKQKARIPEWVDKWVAVGLRTGVADLASWQQGARDCYRHAGLDFPKVVVRAHSPLAGAYLAGALSWLYDQGWDLASILPSDLRCWRDGEKLVLRVNRLSADARSTAPSGESAVLSDMEDCVQAYSDEVWAGVEIGVTNHLTGVLRPGVLVGVDSVVDDSLGRRVRLAVRIAMRDSHWIEDRWTRLGSGVHTGTRVSAAMSQQLGYQEVQVPMSRVRDTWLDHFSGQWSVGWQAYTSFLRDVVRHELPADLWDRDQAFAKAQSSAGWWWPHRQFVVVTDRPTTLHMRVAGEPSTHQLHHATGPAITWRDGWGLHFWGGVLVPPSLIEGDGWTIEEIMAEGNSEIRRCAVERAAGIRGWAAVVAEAGWPQIGPTVPDPGNPGQTLSLYRLEDVYRSPVHLLLMTNGTVERDGTRRTFGETVPASITNPIAAAAWQIGISAANYRRTVRRT